MEKCDKEDKPEKHKQTRKVLLDGFISGKMTGGRTLGVYFCGVPRTEQFGCGPGIESIIENRNGGFWNFK